MSWFGEGFTTLKGQISSFTKEIVANNVVPLTSEAQDETEGKAEVNIKKKLSELEQSCSDKETEISILREENSRLARKLEEFGSSRQQSVEEVTFEQGNSELSTSPLPVISWVDDDCVPDSFLGQETEALPKPSKLAKMEEEISSLRSKLRQTFQDKVLMEQSCSRLEKEVEILTEQLTKRHSSSKEGGGMCQQATQTHLAESMQASLSTSTSPDINRLQQENEQLVQERAQLRGELAAMARVVQDLESQVAVSQDENANLSTGLEELDIQHQEAIEQIMNQKESTQKMYEALFEEYEEIKKNYQELLEKDKPVEEVSRETQTDNLLLGEGCDAIPADTSIENRTRDTCKCTFYIKLLDELTANIPQEYFPGHSPDSAVSKLEGLKKAYMQTLIKYESVDEEARELRQELNQRDYELHSLEGENTTLQRKIDDLIKQQESLPPILEHNEELEALEIRINMLENEIRVLKEMRSNLEAELLLSKNEKDNVIHRLQAAEAMLKNQDNLEKELVKYKTLESDLTNRLQGCQNENAHLLNELSKMKELLNNREREISIELDKEFEKLKKDNKEKEEDLLKHVNSCKDFVELNSKLTKKLENEQLQKAHLEKELESLRNEIIEKNKQLTKGSVIESELTDKLNNCNWEKQELEKCIVNLKSELDIQKKVILELEQERKEIQELGAQNEELKQMLSGHQNYEEMNKKLAEELEFEKTMRKQYEEEKINLSGEFHHLHGLVASKSEQIESLLAKQKENDDLLVREVLLKTRLENEKTHLLNENLRLENIEREMQKVVEELEVERSKQNELLEEKDLMFAEMEKCSQKQKQLEEQLQKNDLFVKQLNLELDQLKMENVKLDESVKQKSKTIEELQQKTKITVGKGVLESKIEDAGKVHNEAVRQLTNAGDSFNELKYLNMVQKCKDFETQVLDLMERVDALKAESTVKDRKLCEILLEKSVFEKELKSQKAVVSEWQKKYADLLNTNEFRLAGDSVTHANLNEEIGKLRREKEELIQSLQVKHKENIDYHAEIQRLNGLLSSEITKTENLTTKCTAVTKNLVELQQRLEEKDALLLSYQASSDRQVTSLKQQIETLQNQLEYASQLLRDVERQEAEGQPASDSPSGKTVSNKERVGNSLSEEERNSLYENLQQEKLRNKYLQNEVQEQHEKETNLVRELERLRSHLMSVEENYTQEMVRAEQQVKELQSRLSQADERVKTSSTAYTSASIRANQQVESLSKQIKTITEQKDKLTAQVASTEDKLHKQAAALTNLQIVLEQFQRDKEKDIEVETERIRQTLQLEKNRNSELCNEIKSLQAQLKEAKEGLSAAARLGEQLDKKTQTIHELKQEVVELTEQLCKTEERVQAASVSVEGKVDRCLVRNLVVGYLCAPPSSRLQALTVIATVLDFSQEDRRRIGLEPSNKGDAGKQQSLSEAFVRFLEHESRPQPQLRLPLTDTDKDSRSRKTSLSEVGLQNLPSTRRTSGSILKDVLKQDGLL